jgi:hypothetical protein
MMPPSECDIQVGQKRLFFIDGVGNMTGTIVSFDENSCFILEEGRTNPDEAWGVGWDMPGMSHISMLVNGEEHKKFMAYVEEEALNGSI